MVGSVNNGSIGTQIRTGQQPQSSSAVARQSRQSPSKAEIDPNELQGLFNNGKDYSSNAKTMQLALSGAPLPRGSIVDKLV